MSTNSLAGLSLDAILGNAHAPKPAECQPQPQPHGQPPPRPPGRRTLIDIIKDDEPSKERRSWRHFRETLLLKRAGEAWSSIVPTSDVPQRGMVSHSGSRPLNFRSNSGEANRMVETMPISDPQFKRGRSGRSKIEVEEEDGADIRNNADSGSMRLMSAREAVAAQEAAEKAKAEAAKAESAKVEESEEEEEDKKPASMSLMDLMGGYGLEEEEEEEEEDEEEEDAEADDGGIEHTCCVCMVRHKGAAFIPCGHTFCRLCSRELMVQRGNCPICNNFILEILDIF